MVDDLLSQYDFKGKTKDEVIELLGTPSRTKMFKDEWSLVYRLGPERSLISIDSEWLAFRFDPNGRVVQCEVLRD